MTRAQGNPAKRYDPYVIRFCNVRHLKPNGCTLQVEYTDGGRPYLTIQDPAVLIRFVGFVMRHYRSRFGGKVFIRAQPRDYGSMRPSLFRDIDDRLVPTLVAAHSALVHGLQRAFINERLRTTEPAPPTLRVQHAMAGRSR